jgi:hypothetical protein
MHTFVKWKGNTTVSKFVFSWENPAPIWPWIFPDPHLFTRPFLSYSAELSVNWQHCGANHLPSHPFSQPIRGHIFHDDVAVYYPVQLFPSWNKESLMP